MSSETTPQKDVTEGQLASSQGHICPFCTVARENGFNIVWEDNDFVAFEDRDPAAAHHLLVTPKRHLSSVKSLRRSDVDMLRKLEEIGHLVLDQRNVPTHLRRHVIFAYRCTPLGFHIPPFSSVNHLHLHVQALPYKSVTRRMKYFISNGCFGKEKGFGWFVEIEQSIRILEKGCRIGVLPC
ncbi:HIT-like protein [Obba rivulosa]|uniref:HIT-like protein n=1 Tax=Obba rivulosa TaxID=1052685 RepID=A0A8E2J4W2_9APHY|nr:HIT-like protein [Obba rivulosa]